MPDLESIVGDGSSSGPGLEATVYCFPFMKRSSTWFTWSTSISKGSLWRNSKSLQAMKDQMASRKTKHAKQYANFPFSVPVTTRLSLICRRSSCHFYLTTDSKPPLFFKYRHSIQPDTVQQDKRVINVPGRGLGLGTLIRPFKGDYRRSKQGKTRSILKSK